MSSSFGTLPKRFPLSILKFIGMGFESELTDPVMACLEFASLIPMDPTVISQHHKDHKSGLVSLICNNERPSYKGEKFLRLAAALQTFGDIDQRAHSLNALLRASARIREDMPSITELSTILGRLEKDLDSGFSELVTQCQEVVGGSAQHPNTESFLALLGSFRMVANDTEYYLEIPASEYAVWSVAFIEWCSGIQPSIKKGNEIMRDSKSTASIIVIV